MEEAKLNVAIQIGNAQFVDSAQKPYRPSSPDHQRNILFGLFIGLGVGIVLAVIIELLDNTVKRSKTTLFDKITKNVSNKNVKTIKDTLDNLLNFEKIEKEEEETIDENDIVLNKKLHLQKLNYKRKEDTLKKYIFNYLVKYCKLLSNINNKSKTVVDKNERLEEKKLLGIEYNFLITFFKETSTLFRL